ncbi:hypothetical protein MNBD_GAMMA10-1607 [hydrothermal vent metagenome]|uniref:Lipopolysaccharide export system protein LptC n=1 Tax=hydrothermal vent metagenome TaxID=652676 RepID=A0A3B0YT98_9ZZZZ
MRTFITLAIFIAIAAISYWMLLDIKHELESDEQISAHFPDYFMENFTITSMDAQGLAQYTLRAKKMRHYDDDDSSEFEQPFLSFNRSDATITIKAKRAKHLKDRNIIFLHDNVIVHRAATAGQSELSIHTEYLKINTQSRVAETDLAAKITTDSAEFNTTGLVFDSLQGTLTLTSQVRGFYETPR